MLPTPLGRRGSPILALLVCRIVFFWYEGNCAPTWPAMELEFGISSIADIQRCKWYLSCSASDLHWVKDVLSCWMNEWMSDWKDNRMSDWMSDWVLGWMGDWMSDWLGGRKSDWVVVWVIEWLISFPCLVAHHIPDARSHVHAAHARFQNTKHTFSIAVGYCLKAQNPWAPLAFGWGQMHSSQSCDLLKSSSTPPE